VQELESWVKEKLRPQHFVVQKLCSGSVSVYRATGDSTSAARLESDEMKCKGFVPHFDSRQMGSETLLYVHMGTGIVNIDDLFKTCLLKAHGQAARGSTSGFRYKLVCHLSRDHFRRVVAINTLKWDPKTKMLIRNCTMQQYRQALRLKADMTVLSTTLTDRGGLMLENTLRHQQTINSWYDGVIAAMPAATWFFETPGAHRSTCPAGQSTLDEFASTTCGPYGPYGPYAC
jgi:hypothetical protein